MSDALIKAIKRAEGEYIIRHLPIHIANYIYCFIFNDTLQEIGKYQKIFDRLVQLQAIFADEQDDSDYFILFDQYNEIPQYKTHFIHILRNSCRICGTTIVKK